MPSRTIPSTLSELRVWLRRTARWGRRAEKPLLMGGMISWAQKEDDPDSFRDIYYYFSWDQDFVRGANFSLQDLQSEALRHARGSAITAGHIRRILGEQVELAVNLVENPRLLVSQRNQIIAHAYSETWRTIETSRYGLLPKYISLGAHCARKREDEFERRMRTELVNYARFGERPEHRSADFKIDPWVQRLTAGSLFSFPNLSRELQETLFEVVISTEGLAKTPPVLLTEAAQNPATDIPILLRMLKGRGKNRTELLSLLAKNPTAIALPEFDKALLSSKNAELLSERLSRARGKSFNRYFRRLAEVSPWRALDALRYKGAAGLEVEDLLPLSLSTSPEVRLAAIRYQAQMSKIEEVKQLREKSTAAVSQGKKR